MSTRTPTGRLERTPEGRDLIITRTFRAPIEDVWTSITESERTARWFGPWEGKGAPGEEIRYQMVFEEGGADSWLSMTIVACEAPRRLALHSRDDWGTWKLEVQLSEADGVTTLRFIQHLDDATDASDVGPGWEFYLDNLEASREGRPRVQWDDGYMRDLKPWYAEQAAKL